MKKHNYKNLKAMLALVLLAIVAAGFAGCGGRMLKVEENIAQQLFAKEDYFVANVYNQEVLRDFDSDTSDNYITDENYYVLVSSDVDQELSQIKLGRITYNKGEQVEIKVSSANTVKRLAYKVTEQKLYVSSLLMFLNASNDGYLTIAFPDNTFHDIRVMVYNENENKLGVAPKTMQEDTLNTLDQNSLRFSFKIDNQNGTVFVEMKNGEESLTEQFPVLYEIVANPSLNNQSSAYKFDVAQPQTELEGSGVVITPGSNAGNDYAPGSPADHTLIYNFYVPTVGSRTVVIEFTNTMTA